MVNRQIPGLDIRIAKVGTNANHLRIHLPMHIARKLGWQEGDDVMWEPIIEGDCVLLRRIKNANRP